MNSLASIEGNLVLLTNRWVYVETEVTFSVDKVNILQPDTKEVKLLLLPIHNNGMKELHKYGPVTKGLTAMHINLPFSLYTLMS